jgi:putative transposase
MAQQGLRCGICAAGTGSLKASYYLSKSKFGGMAVSDAKGLKELETENARLKKLLAKSVLENEVAREALRKKW